MDRDNAIIIILLIIIVLSIGAYIVVTGVGISFNKSDDVTNVSHTNNRNTTLNTTSTGDNTVRHTGAVAPETTDSDSSESSTVDYSSQSAEPASQDTSSDSSVPSEPSSQAGQDEGTVDPADFD